MTPVYLTERNSSKLNGIPTNLLTSAFLEAPGKKSSHFTQQWTIYILLSKKRPNTQKSTNFLLKKTVLRD